MTTDLASPIRLDVRPTLAAGGEPFSEIMAAAGRVPQGGILELTAPFEPVPLYGVMSGRGFGHVTEVRSAGDVVVRFHRLGITADATAGDVYQRYPVTAGVFAEIGADMCCGATKPLSTVAQAHGVEIARLLGSLQQAALENGRAQ